MRYNFCDLVFPWVLIKLILILILSVQKRKQLPLVKKSWDMILAYVESNICSLGVALSQGCSPTLWTISDTFRKSSGLGGRLGVHVISLSHWVKPVALLWWQVLELQQQLKTAQHQLRVEEARAGESSRLERDSRDLSDNLSALRAQQQEEHITRSHKLRCCWRCPVWLGPSSTSSALTNIANFRVRFW